MKRDNALFWEYSIVVCSCARIYGRGDLVCTRCDEESIIMKPWTQSSSAQTCGAAHPSRPPWQLSRLRTVAGVAVQGLEDEGRREEDGYQNSHRTCRYRVNKTAPYTVYCRNCCQLATYCPRRLLCSVVTPTTFQIVSASARPVSARWRGRQEKPPIRAPPSSPHCFVSSIDAAATSSSRHGRRLATMRRAVKPVGKMAGSLCR